jgi:uncharacterized protein (DUF305 family)
VNQDANRFAILLALIASLTLLAWTRDIHSHRPNPTIQPGWQELVGSLDTMHAAMAAVEPSGDSDADFVRLMLPHHQAAIEMAKTQILFGKNPQMRRLAQEIITDQRSEIELMQLWLTQHEPNPPKK